MVGLRGSATLLRPIRCMRVFPSSHAPVFAPTSTAIDFMFFLAFSEYIPCSSSLGPQDLFNINYKAAAQWAKV